MQKIPEPAMDNVEQIVYTHGDMLFRICLVMLGNKTDAEDALQETILKYLQKAPVFRDAEHEKAWLITVATNQCRDMLRFRLRHPQVDITYIKEMATTPKKGDVLQAVMMLPESFRTVMVLYYVEEYKVAEIASMIGKTVSAVKMRLQKGRKLLEETYRKEFL